LKRSYLLGRKAIKAGMFTQEAKYHLQGLPAGASIGQRTTWPGDNLGASQDRGELDLSSGRRPAESGDLLLKPKATIEVDSPQMICSAAGFLNGKTQHLPSGEDTHIEVPPQRNRSTGRRVSSAPIQRCEQADQRPHDKRRPVAGYRPGKIPVA